MSDEEHDDNMTDMPTPEVFSAALLLHREFVGDPNSRQRVVIEIDVAPGDAEGLNLSVYAERREWPPGVRAN
jgi:hypothetical protein